MRITRNVIEKLLIGVLLLTFAINVCSVSANAMQALDGSIDGLWEGISNPFPAQPINAIDFVDTINDGTNVSPDDYLGYATKWNGNGDTRVKRTELIDGQNTDVLEVTNTYNSPWQGGRWGMTPLFTTQDISLSKVTNNASKVKNHIRWSVDLKIVLGAKTTSTKNAFLTTVGWKTGDNNGCVIETNGPLQFSRNTSDNKYSITSFFNSSDSIELESGEWYRFQMEFDIDDYKEKTSADEEPNTATMAIVIYGFDDEGELISEPLAKWGVYSWNSMAKYGNTLYDTLCQELCVLVRNSNITSYSVANAYMVREAWYGDVSISEDEDKVSAMAAIYPQFVAGGSYTEPSADGTPVLVLAGYDALNTLVNSKGDIGDMSTSMICELNKDNKINRYNAYLWHSPDRMQLFVSPKELNITQE